MGEGDVRAYYHHQHHHHRCCGCRHAIVHTQSFRNEMGIEARGHHIHILLCVLYINVICKPHKTDINEHVHKSIRIQIANIRERERKNERPYVICQRATVCE